MRTFVKAPALRRAILSIRHSYVRVLLNGVPVINSANWWSSDWNVQVQLKAGVNEIEVQIPPRSSLWTICASLPIQPSR